MIRFYEIKLKPGQKEDCLKEVVFNKLGNFSKEIDPASIKISGKSIDARNKKNIMIIYNVDFELKSVMNNQLTEGIREASTCLEDKFVSKVKKKNKKIKLNVITKYKYNPTENPAENPAENKKNEMNRPVIVGFGPAGMFAALYFIYNGIQPIIIERGKKIEERVEDVKDFWTKGIFNENSNPLFGEGGAGTFSDGKLTTGKNDPRIPFILNEFYKAGAPEEILYAKNPHIGTDVLRSVVKNIRKTIIDHGGEIRFQTKLVSINTICENNSQYNSNSIENHSNKNVKLKSINTIDDRDKAEEIPANNLILAMGHSARDTYESLQGQGLYMEQKPFSIGLRIQHEQARIDEAQFGSNFESIYGMTFKDAGMPAAEYKLSHRLDSGRGVYTFCMCPGGEIITLAAEEDTVSVNGMSNQARDGKYSNSALLVDVRTDDYESSHPLAGIEFQRKYEKLAFNVAGASYRPPTEKVGDFLKEDGSSILEKCLPEFAVKGIREALPVFARRINGFDDKSAILKGIESGSSSPVRIKRDENFMGSIKGIYPCGEGAGYSGGITSSAVDGLKCAEAVQEK